ncbi:MAG: branched-chain amino acid ABC transporter permease [Halobacteriota archaeon]
MSTHATTIADDVAPAWVLAGVFVVLALAPFAIVQSGSTFRAQLMISLLVLASLAVALDIVFGQTDQLFLFLGGLAGVGAYTTIGLSGWLGMSAWWFVLVSALLAGSIGLLVSYVAARRRMTIIVIAILTLSLQLAAEEVFGAWRDLTGGSTGIRFDGLELPLLADVFGSLFDPRVGSRMALYYLLLVGVIALLIGYRQLLRSRYGLAFKAIRQDEIAAESIGIDVIRYKTLAGFTAAFVIGLIGPFYAQSQSIVTPALFTFVSVDVMVLIILVLGGMRTLTGPIVGAAVVIYLTELLRGFERWTTAIFGALLIVLFLYFRSGIVPKARELAGGGGPADALDRVRSLLGR